MFEINVREYRRGNQKRTIQKNCSQYEEIHKTICVGHHYVQANTHNVNKRHETSHIQLKAKTNRT